MFTANPDTQHLVYALTLDRLVGQLGPDMPVAAITTPILARFLATTYAHLAPASHNRVVATLGSLFAYTTRQGWTPVSPAAGLERRHLRSGPRDHARTRAIPEAELLAFLTADHPVRDKTLWWLLYESAARAGEVLALDVEDLDLAHRLGPGAPQSRGDRQRRSGRADRLGKLKPPVSCPVCCTSGGKARCSWPISPPPRPASPRWPTSTPTRVGPGCLTGGPPKYSRKATGGWTLHQLRHSRLTHLAEAGIALPILMAKSRHTSLSSLGIYAKPTFDAVAAATAAIDPDRRH